MTNIILAPSLLAANLLNLQQDLQNIQVLNLSHIHLDIMDGHFVPNLSYGPNLAKILKEQFNFIIDTHLMCKDPEKFIDMFLPYSDIITFHYEATLHIDRLIGKIKESGKKAGISLLPTTPISTIKYVVENLDLVLLMTVNPGFGGQKYINYVNEKIQELKNISHQVNPNLLIAVDGGINKETSNTAISYGANYIIAGTYFFANPQEAIKNILHKP